MNDFVDKFNAVPLAQRIFGLIALMVLIVAGFYFLLLEPLNTDIANQQTKLVELQREKERLEQLKRNRAIVIAQLEKLKAQLLIAQEKLPQDAEIPSLLQRIHNQAKTAGLDINKFRRLPDRPQQYYIEIPVEMELRGTYDELANFLYYVGRMTRIVNVKNLDMTRVNKGLTPDGELAIKAQGTTFRYAKPGAASTSKKGKKK
ncbi:MAG: type 4a pilus biogenesis protein PilO [bacterium]